ncbi:MAG: PKD domain-containing protein [Chloroflexi bacterium]|nr:PKD domain-containing protein [Chloroflexota bacterium]
MRVKAITGFSLILIFSLFICYSAFSASIFTVVGTVTNSDGTLATTGLEVTVTNETRNLTVTTAIGKQESGKYGVVFINMENERVAAEGDSLKVNVKSGGNILGSQMYKLTSEDITKARAVIDLKLEPFIPVTQPLVASFTYSPESPGVGDEITFDASASNAPDGDIVSYQWDFGDGNIASGEKVTHSYDTPYTYIITLTVTDDGGDKAEQTIGLPTPLIGGGSFIVSYSGSPTLEIANLDKGDREQLYNVIKQVLNIGEAKSKLIGELDETLLSDVNLLLNQLHPDKQDKELAVKDVVKENALSEGQELFVGFAGGIAGAGITFLTGIPAPFGLGEVAKLFGLKLGEWMILKDMGSATVKYPSVGRMEIVWRRPPEDKIFVNIYLNKPAKRACMIISVGEWRNELKIDWRVNAHSTVPVWNAFAYPPENTLTDPESIIDHVQIVSLHSPIELRVYDSQGRVTGLVNGEIREEIPGSVYDKERKEAVIFSPSDSYRYEIVGTDEGKYELEVKEVEGGEVATFTATDIPTSPSAVHQYTVDWDALSEGEAEAVTVQMDSDGDGTFEEIINTGATFTPVKERPWDVNSDGTVDMFDLIIVGKHLGESPLTHPGADVNKDGAVDISDLVLVGKHFGESYFLTTSKNSIE